MRDLWREHSLAFEEWINEASYEDLLRYWRFTVARHPVLEIKELLDKAFDKNMRSTLKEDRDVISKKVGWGMWDDVMKRFIPDRK
jgi:hypothetical protein